MAGVYSNVYLQFVFVVKGRQSLIPKEKKERLHEYITGFVRNCNSKLLAVHCMPDHTHLFVGYDLAVPVPDFVREFKKSTNKFIRENKIADGEFSWQSGYGVFTYSRSHIDRVIKYIKNQEKRHAKENFKREFEKLLDAYESDADRRYLFEPVG